MIVDDRTQLSIPYIVLLNFTWESSLFLGGVFSFEFLSFKMKTVAVIIEPRHEKTGFLHMRKQRGRSASR